MIDSLHCHCSVQNDAHHGCTQLLITQYMKMFEAMDPVSFATVSISVATTLKHILKASVLRSEDEDELLILLEMYLQSAAMLQSTQSQPPIVALAVLRRCQSLGESIMKLRRAEVERRWLQFRYKSNRNLAFKRLKKAIILLRDITQE